MTTAPQVQLMSPEEAGQILATCKFPRQRRIRAAWVAELADIIGAGTWQTTTITICECAEDGKSYLVDGYHRLSAILQAGIPAPLLVYREQVDTLKTVGQIYSRLDRGMPRNVSDGLVARDLPNELHLTASVLRAGVAAVNVIRADFKHDSALSNKRGYDEKFKGVIEWVPELRAYTEAIAGAPTDMYKKLLRAAILAVGLTLFRHQAEKARDFFHSVATLTDLAQGSAQQVFCHKLLSEEEGARAIGTSTMCRYTAACWNAYWENRPLERLRTPSETKQGTIVIHGTPFTEWQALPKK